MIKGLLPQTPQTLEDNKNAITTLCQKFQEFRWKDNSLKKNSYQNLWEIEKKKKKKSEYPCIYFKKSICKSFPQREFQDQRVPSVNSIKYSIPCNLLKNTEMITNQFVLQDKDNYNTKTWLRYCQKKKKIIKQYPSWIETPKFLTKKQIKFNNTSCTKF